MKRTKNFEKTIRQLSKAIETQTELTFTHNSRISMTPSLIANKSPSTCFDLANGKLVPRSYKFVRPIAIEITDFPARAVFIAHIVDKLTVAFGGHPQYGDVFTRRRSLTDDQFVKVMSAQADDIQWQPNGDRRDVVLRVALGNAIASPFASAMMGEDQMEFKKY